MAPRKNAKKQPEAPQVNIGAEIFASLRELEKVKGIPVDYMVERLKQAMANAYRKDREDHRDIPAENVVVDLSEDGLYMYQIKTVVEEVEDSGIEIHIARDVGEAAAEEGTAHVPGVGCAGALDRYAGALPGGDHSGGAVIVPALAPAGRLVIAVAIVLRPVLHGRDRALDRFLRGHQSSLLLPARIVLRTIRLSEQ